MGGFTQMPVGELVTTVRDVVFFISILVAGWKLRAVVQPAIDFLVTAKDTMSRANEHMDVMEAGMQTLLSNHLTHIEADLGRLSGRRSTDTHEPQ